MDTRSGKIVRRTSLQAIDGQPLTLDTPPIAADIAAWIRCPD
jgi:hypothetical protein